MPGKKEVDDGIPSNRSLLLSENKGAWGPVLLQKGEPTGMQEQDEIKEKGDRKERKSISRAKLGGPGGAR
jgi:hypothetical protein